MTRWRGTALIFLAALSLAGCGKSSVPSVPTWSVSGGFIRDAQGRAVILRGATVSGAQRNPPYISPLTFDDYQRLRDEWGFNSIRFVMTWAAIEPQKGQFDQHYLDEVATRMAWAEKLGLSVILDMHQDIYGEGFGFDGAPKWACDSSYYAAFEPTTPWAYNAINPNVEACTDQLYTNPETLAQFLAAWNAVAQKLKGSKAVLGFDALNEPEWGTYDPTTFERDRLEPFYEKIVATVRQTDPKWLAFLEPGANRNIGIPTSLTPFRFANVVYAPHSYDDTAETTGRFPPEDVPNVIENDAALAREAQSLQAALWVGEYGGHWDDPNIGAYMGAQYQGIGAVAGSSDLWDINPGGGYSPIDANDAERPALANAVVLPYPSRVAGTPVSYAFDQDTSAFTVTYGPDAKISAPTEITIPPRVYRSGYQVACGGCAWHKTATGIEISKPASGAKVTVTLTPSKG